MAADSSATGQTAVGFPLARERNFLTWKTLVPGVVRVSLGLILVAAAALKGHQVATEPVAETDFLTSRWALVAGVELELALGVWLVSGYRPVTAQRAAFACFAIFAGVSLIRAVGGAGSCGCFGRVQVSPWLTFVVDLVAVVAIRLCDAVSRSDANNSRAPAIRFQAGRACTALVAFAVFGFPMGWAMATFVPTRPEDQGAHDIGEGAIVLLEPGKWVGKSFPLREYVDIGPRLAEGRWIVILYHHNCPKCQALIAGYRSKAQATRDSDNSVPVALIEMPPFGSTATERPLANSVACGRLSDTREWVATTPIELEIEEGTVIRASEDGK